MPDLIDDDELDRQLREAAPYIDDAGFTSQVLKSLPARPAAARLRSAILLAMTALASILAYVLSGGGGFVHDLVARISDLPMTWLLALTLTAGLLVGALGLAAAIFKSREAPSFARL